MPLSTVRELGKQKMKAGMCFWPHMNW